MQLEGISGLLCFSLAAASVSYKEHGSTLFDSTSLLHLSELVMRLAALLLSKFCTFPSSSFIM